MATVKANRTEIEFHAKLHIANRELQGERKKLDLFQNQKQHQYVTLLGPSLWFLVQVKDTFQHFEEIFQHL